MAGRTPRHGLLVRLSLLLLFMAAVAAALLSVRGDPDDDEASGPETAPLVQLPAADPSRVNLLAFGDWGQDTLDERDVAAGIRSYGVTFDAGLLLGDNFYLPLTGGVDDPKWRSLFE